MANKNKIILSTFIIIFLYIGLFLGIKFIDIINFSYDLLIIFTFFVIFLIMHIFLNINKMYEKIYKYRYSIGIIILTYITILGYNGSSIAFWNRIIQPNLKSYNTILGLARGIRSDEWMVTTPSIFSQIYNGFSSTNNIIMGISSKVILYPTLPSFDISIISNIFNIPFLILPFENAFALVWYVKLFVMFFAWFELFMIITKQKKLYSLLGTMLLTFSAANMWWYFNPILTYGALAILIFYKFVNVKDYKYKLLLSFLLGVIGLNYLFVLYPAWQIPYAYIFLCFVIWILIENKDKLKWTDLFYIIIPLTLIIGISIYTFKSTITIYNLLSNTVYPGSRFSTGGYGYNLLFNYFAGIFYPIKNYFNPSEMSNFISFYPIPIFMSLFYLFKTKKKDMFLIIFTTCAILLSLWYYIELPPIIAKLSLISYSTPERANIVVGFICVLLTTRLISLYEKKVIIKQNKKILIGILSILYMILTILIAYQILDDYLNKKMMLASFLVFVPLIYLLILNRIKTNKYFAIILIILSLYVGSTVNPINKGLDVLTEKPFAKEVQKIVNKNSKGKWLVVNGDNAIPNYLIANGASTINSVNYYPNLELWNKLNSEKKYEDIYNRYAHITVKLTHNNTDFELVQNDKFNINLNVNDIMLLNVDYIVAEEDISVYNNELIKFKLLYFEDNIYIYEIERQV